MRAHAVACRAAEPIWRQLGVPDRVLIDTYRGKSRRREFCPPGSRNASKIPLTRLDTVCWSDL